jgi:retron-type reverse transcriptase
VINAEGQFQAIYLIMRNKDIIYIKITLVDTNEIKINIIEILFKILGIKFNLKNNRNNFGSRFYRKVLD